MTFQRHRRSGFPKVLQDEATTSPPEQENIPQASDRKHRINKTSKKTHRRSKDIHKTKKSHRQRIQEQKQKKGLRHLPSLVNVPAPPPASSTLHIYTPKTTEETKSIELGNPITSFTPLQYTFGFPQVGVIYASDLNLSPEMKFLPLINSS
jgi:hypothetical protein